MTVANAPRTPPPALPLRPPGVVMRLARMGAFHQTRLSFMRTLLRRLAAEHWSVERTRWRIAADGTGSAVYEARGPHHRYSLVCFAHRIDPAERTDRVIAERWDATFALFDGVPDEADLDRLAANVPLQEAGRCSQSELVLSRANKSVRLFEHVLGRLADGRQPDPAQIAEVGYLMRTTAVYGNGKFGVADRERIAVRPELAGPFRAEMLAVWLIRAFTVDLVEHLARARAPDKAVAMDRDLRRALGVGNATGLGMAPFLVNHPALLHTWMAARETALARVRAVQRAENARQQAFAAALAGARQQVAGWRTADARQSARIERLARDLQTLDARAGNGYLDGPRPWDALYRWAESALDTEAQELLVSLLIEPHGDLVDGLGDCMSLDEEQCFRIDGTWPLQRLRASIERDYAWALAADFAGTRNAHSRFWYVSEEKLEPRLGERFDEPGAELEQPYATGRDVAALYRDSAAFASNTRLGKLLLVFPQHRHAARRVQVAARFPYAEIRDNLVGADLVPIDLLRCKLSFFGATRFDPRSDRWVRITMFQGAPFPDELAGAGTDFDDWVYPCRTAR